MKLLNSLPCSSLFLVLMVGCLLPGCQPSPHSDKETGKVTIKVTNGDKPVTAGFVNLANNQTGLGGGGELGEDGTTTIPAVPVGEYVVTVTPPLPDPVDPNPPKQDYPDIPKKYRSETTSTLKATVTTETNELIFDLSK